MSIPKRKIIFHQTLRNGPSSLRGATEKYSDIEGLSREAVKGKKMKMPVALVDTGSPNQNPDFQSASSAISVADFLDNVKTIPIANEIFSDDVAQRLIVSRTQGNLSQSLVYALPENVTLDDIKELRSIPRKSINGFTPEEIRKTEKWARKFYSELKEKSPFFRAWFGDWRAYDTKTIQIVDEKGYSKGTKVVNSDTGWEINVNRKISKETNSHRG